MGLPVIATNWSGPTAFLVGHGAAGPTSGPAAAPAAAVAEGASARASKPPLSIPTTSQPLQGPSARCPPSTPPPVAPTQDESVGYPLPIEGLVEAPKGTAFEGHRWAQPSVPALRQLMRRVVEQRGEAAAKGAAARARMVERYAPEVVAQLVASRLRGARPRGSSGPAAGKG